MKILININEPNKELFVISDDVGINETEFGFSVHAKSATQNIILRDKKNYKWLQK